MSSSLLPLRYVHALTFAALAFAAVPTIHAANQVPDAPTVSNAPIVDKPLTPAANDTPGEQPTTQHAWVPGHWRWHEGSYVWESGRWEVPPTPNVTWSPPEWRQQGNGYQLQEGYWQEQEPTRAGIVSAPPPAETVFASEPPPAPQREMIYERPTPTHVWIPGYWGWRDGRHVWVAGQWALAPRANLTWVPPRWEHRGGNRYAFVDGYWREAVMMAQPAPAPQQVVLAQPQVAQPQQVIVVAAPPQPRHEVVYARPSAYHIWIPGYWAWSGGRHVWIAGHYEVPPRGYRTWEQPRWERRGGNYIMIDGRWR